MQEHIVVDKKLGFRVLVSGPSLGDIYESIALPELPVPITIYSPQHGTNAMIAKTKELDEPFTSASDDSDEGPSDLDDHYWHSLPDTQNDMDEHLELDALRHSSQEIGSRSPPKQKHYTYCHDAEVEHVCMWDQFPTTDPNDSLFEEFYATFTFRLVPDQNPQESNQTKQIHSETASKDNHSSGNITGTRL
ncbi:MAG: hypothetical protein MMC23_001459 [Stictis urceolatum]|nr:hypothetical protein [Stictis urceolata]